MPALLSLPRTRLAACLALALLATPALAADFDGPYGPPRGPEPGYEPARPYPPPPPPVPEYRRPHFTGGPEFGPPPPPEGNCRVFVKRRFDAYGEPVLRRVKVCDEGPSFGPRHRPVGFDGPPPPDGGPGWRWRPH